MEALRYLGLWAFSIGCLVAVVLAAYLWDNFAEPPAGYLCRYCKGVGRFGTIRNGAKQIPICPRCKGSGENQEVKIERMPR